MGKKNFIPKVVLYLSLEGSCSSLTYDIRMCRGHIWDPEIKHLSVSLEFYFHIPALECVYNFMAL